MKAITQDRFGTADVLALRDIERPTPGTGEVLVEVRAAGCGPDVWHTMTGKPYLARPMLGWRHPKWPALGRDVAGVVAQTGPGVTSHAVGDEVYGTSATGSFAQYSLSPVTTLAAKPKTLSFEQAAAAPISGGTALQALQSVPVTAGMRVLVIGAGGGVGSWATQIAVAHGATVTAVCSTKKADLARSLGASDVLDYTREEIDRDGPVYDVVLDTAGNRRLSLLRRALTPTGTLLLIGGEQRGGSITGGFQRQLYGQMLSPFVRQRLVGVVAKERADTLAELARLIDSGAAHPVVGSTFTLADAADAVRHVSTGHTTGKVVITVPAP